MTHLNDTDSMCSVRGLGANDNGPTAPRLSDHASQNCRRRGVKGVALDAIWRHADMVAPRGDGVMLYQISRRTLAAMGARTPEGVPTDQLRNLAALVSNDNTMLTVVKPRQMHYKHDRKVER